MGYYLNSKKPFMMFLEDRSSGYFVDKTRILDDLIPAVDVAADEPDSQTETALPSGKAPKYICITRPRHFGKTMAANMISSYFGKGSDSQAAFQDLAVSSRKWFDRHINQHNVIHIMCNEMPDNCTSYIKYISRIKQRLLHDLIRQFPDVLIEQEDSLWDAFNNIIEFGTGEKFIFILDEWDFIFHRDFITDHDKMAYLDFLGSLLKDQPYVELAYLTGILPIAKYSSGSELNMFCEYTMISEQKFSTLFGFTSAETDLLYQKYLEQANGNAVVTRDGLRIWYDGYDTRSGERVYNPRSVILALTNNNLGNYWTSSGPYDEIFSCIRKNTDAVRDDLAMLVSGTPVRAKIFEYAAVSMELTTKNEIFSAMVVYGFLNYKDGFVSIPNQELMEQFVAF